MQACAVMRMSDSLEQHECLPACVLCLACSECQLQLDSFLAMTKRLKKALLSRRQTWTAFITAGDSRV